MNRSTFIKLATVAGLGTFIPSRLWAFTSPNIKHSLIPTDEGHIRHGLYSHVEYETPGFPGWFKAFRREHLYANGISETNDDLFIFPFQVMEERFACLEKNGVFHLAFDETEIALSEDSPSVVYTRNKFHIEQISDTSDQSLTGNDVFIGLSGKHRIGNRVISKMEILSYPSFPIEIHSEPSAKGLLIKVKAT